MTAGEKKETLIPLPDCAPEFNESLVYNVRYGSVLITGPMHYSLLHEVRMYSHGYTCAEINVHRSMGLDQSCYRRRHASCAGSEGLFIGVRGKTVYIVHG